MSPSHRRQATASGSPGPGRNSGAAVLTVQTLRRAAAEGDRSRARGRALGAQSRYSTTSPQRRALGRPRLLARVAEVQQAEHALAVGDADGRAARGRAR